MTASIDKSWRPINVACVDVAGRQGTATSKSSLEPWFLGNILLGGLTGMAIDVLDGAVNKYETPISVAFGGGTPQAPVALERPQVSTNTTASTSLTPAATTVTASSISAQIVLLARRPVIHFARRREFLAKVAEVDERTAALLRMDTARGLVLLDVVSKGVAASGGLKAGDVILGFNGVPVSAIGDLTRQLETIPHGERAQVSLWREGEARSLLIRL